MSWREKRVLITGGAGFIGSHLAERLLGLGARVTVLDNMSTGLRSNIEFLRSIARPGTLEIREGSICASSDVTQAMDGTQVVFHLAARPSVSRSIEDPLNSHETNVNGSLVLLEAAKARTKAGKGFERFVFTSSSSVYGNTPVLPKEEPMAGSVLSPYALQKWTTENYVRMYWQFYGVPGLSIRPFNIFGPRQSDQSAYAAVIPLFFRAAREGKPLVIFGDGQQSRDFTYVDNIVDLYLSAATGPEASLGQSFNAGAGRKISVLELAREIISLTGSPSTIEFRDARSGDVRDSLACLKRSESLLGYRPQVSVHDGLKRLMQA
jgi:UDP-glucose 4-epimerase